MNPIALSILLLLLIIFLALAILFSMGKGAFLIAGYNTLPAEEKAKFDEPALCKFMGKITFGFSLGIVLFIIGELLELRNIFVPIGSVLIVLLSFFAAIYGNKEGNFRRHD